MGIGNLHCLFSLFIVRLYVSYKFEKDFNMNKGNENIICVMDA
jgi:hypothetical protein